MKRLAGAARELEQLRRWDPALGLRCTCSGAEGRGVNHVRELFHIPEFYGRPSKELSTSDDLHRAATRIGSGFRGMVGRREFARERLRADNEELLRAVRTCQKCIRRVRYLNITRPHRMAALLQAHWRGYRTRRWWKQWSAEERGRRVDAAAARIQRAYRGEWGQLPTHAQQAGVGKGVGCALRGGRTR